MLMGMEILYIQLKYLHTETVCKYWNEAPGLGLLHFPHSSLNSCLTYGQYHTAYYLVMQPSMVWTPKQTGSAYVTGTTIASIMYLPQCTQQKWPCLHAFIHPFIQHCVWRAYCVPESSSTYILRIWTVHSFSSCRA